MVEKKKEKGGKTKGKSKEGGDLYKNQEGAPHNTHQKSKEKKGKSSSISWWGEGGP